MSGNDPSWSDHGWSDDDRPSILRVENCSEIDIAGNFYKQDGKYYDDCCDLQNAEDPECQTCFDSTVCIIVMCISCAIFVLFCIIFVYGWFCGLPPCTRCGQFLRKCCQRERPTVLSELVSVSAETPTPLPTRQEIQEPVINRLPRSKATDSQCSGKHSTFYDKLINLKY